MDAPPAVANVDLLLQLNAGPPPPIPSNLRILN
jgi:hypothetical protein